MRCDIVIKTWKPDLPWLGYCLRFLRKNWRERSGGVVIIANEDCREGIKELRLGSADVEYMRGEQAYFVRPWPDTYNFHMYLSLIVDDFSDAEVVVFVDSDLMLTKPTFLRDLMEDNRPVIYYEETSKLLASTDEGTRNHTRIWYPIMERFCGMKPNRDFMVNFPLLYWMDTIQWVRRMITARTGKSVLDSLYSDIPFNPEKFIYHNFTFCDYECLGMWASIGERSRYSFKHVSQRPQERTRLFHSWSQWNERTKDELEKLLAEL